MSEIRCHTVPQFYLNYFLEPGSSLFWVYDKKNDAIRPQTPINTTVIGDYYLSSPDVEGRKDKRMEYFLAAIEGMAKPILDKWKNDLVIWDEEEKSIVAMFLSFIHTRSPRAVGIAKEINMAGLEHIFDEMKKLTDDSVKVKKYYEQFRVSDGWKELEKKGLEVSLEEFKQMMVNPRDFGEPSINEKYALGESFNTAHNIYTFLMQMSWSIYAIQNKRFFVTSDAPMVVFAQTNDGKAIFGSGFALPNVQIVFPISPKLCLWLDKRKRHGYEIIGADFVEEMNRRVIHMAERFVISPYKSNRIQKVVKEFGDNFGKPKIDVEAMKEKFRNEGVNLEPSK